MTIFFVIIAIVFVIGTGVVAYFAQTVPILDSLLIYFIVVSAVLGGIALVFTIIKVKGEINKIPDKKEKIKDKVQVQEYGSRDFSSF